MKRFPRTLIGAFLCVGTLLGGLSAEPTLETAGAPYAPLDPKKGKEMTNYSSAGDREEAVKEFKGLMSMALAKVSLSKWAGKSISDCEQHSGSGSDWCARCEVIMPHANGFYYFYPEGGACTLQQFDAQVHVAQGSFLSELKKPLQSYFGRGVPGKVAAGSVGRHWQTAVEVADLIMETSEGEPFARFVWIREPLIVRNPSFVHRFALSELLPRTDN